MHTLPEHSSLEIPFPEAMESIDAIVFRKRRTDGLCAAFTKTGENLTISSTYYVGADWISKGNSIHWFFVEPKLNPKYDHVSGEPISLSPDEATNLKRIDVSKMLFEALSHPGIYEHTQELFEIKFDSPHIPLPKQDDLLSPLLIIRFLTVVKEIVRKGLKKCYYPVDRNLYGKVKGKVLVGQTIKQNHAKNKDLHTYCRFEEFGDNGIENRLIKKTLLFVQRYLHTFKGLMDQKFFQQTMDFIQPAFSQVSADVELHQIKQVKFNAFYKDYNEAVRLAQIILKRFGYNIQAIQNLPTIDTPPYWIDMSKLFELYVLGKLKDRFKSTARLEYQFGDRANHLDFLLDSGSHKMVIDAKYKTRYIDHFKTEDIRQVSGYARLKKVHKFFNLDHGTLIDCLIVYPDIENGEDDVPEKLDTIPINHYFGMYKLGLNIPLIS